MRCSLARLDGKALIGTPFRPGPVIDSRPAMPDLGEREGEHARRDARAAACHHGLPEIDARLVEQRLDLGAALERAILLQQLPVGKIVRAGNMA